MRHGSSQTDPGVGPATADGPVWRVRLWLRVQLLCDALDTAQRSGVDPVDMAGNIPVGGLSNINAKGVSYIFNPARYQFGHGPHIETINAPNPTLFQTKMIKLQPLLRPNCLEFFQILLLA